MIIHIVVDSAITRPIFELMEPPTLQEFPESYGVGICRVVKPFSPLFNRILENSNKLTDLTATLSIPMDHGNRYWWKSNDCLITPDVYGGLKAVRISDQQFVIQSLSGEIKGKLAEKATVKAVFKYYWDVDFTTDSVVTFRDLK